MPRYVILSGSIKHQKKFHGVGAELELDVEQADAINKKGAFLELAELHQAKKKAAADAQAAIEKAEKDAAEKLKSKGGAK